MHWNQNIRRRGSALLVCTLAAAVLSMAAIAILRSNQHSINRVESLRTATVGRHVAEGLTQRAIATLRINPNAAGEIVDREIDLPEATCQMLRRRPDATQIRVYLYQGAVVPAVDLVVDPRSL